MQQRRPMVTLIAGLLMSAAGVLGAFAQETQTLPVPLSSPGQPAWLEIGLVEGSIKVSAWEGQEIVVRATPRKSEEKVERVDGMLRIPNNSIGLTIEETDNRVEVHVGWASQRIDLEVQVPVQTSLRLSTVNGGDIGVSGVEGELELSNTNGAIHATDVAGSVVANTTNGDVVVTLRRIDPDKPMSFSSWNGKVDVTFPPSLAADLRLRAGQGAIYSDFDVELKPTEASVEREESRRGYRLKLEREVRGTVGGGGPEISLKTFNGTVFLRRAG